MTSISQLRNALSSIENYNLPERLQSSEIKSDSHSTKSNSIDTSKSPKSVNETSPNITTNTSTQNNESSSTPSPSSNPKPPLLTKEMIQRYHQARDTYLQHRMTEMFLECLSSMKEEPQEETAEPSSSSSSSSNSSSNSNTLHIPFRPTLELPPTSTPEEEAELRRLSQKVKMDLCQTSQRVQTGYHNLHAKFKTFCDKREELKRMIDDLEMMEVEKRRKSGRMNHVEDEEDEDVTNYEMSDDEDDEDDEENEQDVMEEQELQQQEERLKALRVKKSQMESQLRRIQMQSLEVSTNIQRSKSQVKRMLTKRGADEEAASIAALEEEEDVDMNQDELEWNATEMQQETEELQKRAERYKQMSEYFDSIRGAMEELGGIKILNVSYTSEQEGNSSSSQKSGASSRRSSPSNKSGANSIHVKVLLLDKHVVLVTLTSNGMKRLIQRRFASSTSSSPSSPTEEYAPVLRVTDAQFQTSMVLTDVESSINDMMTDEKMPKKPTVSITIPPLDDLVIAASNLEPKHDFQFIISETISRIRTLTARVEQLSQLRAKYLTKITKFSSSSPSKKTPSNGGINSDNNSYAYGSTEDQEVVCSLNVGITVVLSLTADCPIIEGSVFISKMVGVGGWDDSCLARIKSRVNERKVKGPVEIMDALVDEISKAEREEGVVIPETPVFPNKKVRRGIGKGVN